MMARHGSWDPGAAATVLRSWFALTPEERRWMRRLLLLALLGLAVRAWHLRHKSTEISPPATSAAEPLGASGP